MDFIDLFSGIGTIRMGMEQAGHKCVYSVENDKFKRSMYGVIFGSEPDGNDIKDVKGTDLPRSDAWCFGFPCTNISQARRDNVGISGDKSKVIFEVFRLLEETEADNRPTYLFIENVKQILFINGGWDFYNLLNILDGYGYDAEWSLHDSKDFGVPQHRERLYIVGHYRGRRSRKVFPISVYSRNSIIQIGRIEGIKGFDILKRCYSLNGISPTLNSCNGGNRHVKFYIPTEEGFRIRQLTPKEYWRLQGINEEIINKVINAGFSDSQLYKGAGDACTVNVIYEIAKRL